MNKYQFITLITTSIICGILWRLEVEYYGWTGLIWTTYFHWTIPIACSLFILWMNLIIKLKPLKRLTFNASVVFLGVLTYFILKESLIYNYITGPAAMMLILGTDELKITAVRILVFIVPPILPLLAFGLLKVHGIKIRKRNLLMSEISLLLSLPLSMFILYIVGHKGGYDELHALKSGVLIPFVIFTFGLLVIGDKKKTTPEQRI